MISRRHVLLASLGGWFALIATGCRILNEPIDRVSAELKDGSQFCSEVRVPKAWEGIPDPFEMSGIYSGTRDRSGILFSLQIPSAADREATKEKYWIDLDHRGQIRPATDDEWKAAPPLEQVSGSNAKLTFDGNEPSGVVRKDRRSLFFNGNKFTKKGDIWYAPGLTHGDKYLVLMSYDGYSAGPKSAIEGDYYIEVFNVKTGKRLAMIEGQSRYDAPYIPFRGLYWLSDRDLVFLYGMEARNLIVCRFD